MRKREAYWLSSTFGALVLIGALALAGCAIRATDSGFPLAADTDATGNTSRSGGAVLADENETGTDARAVQYVTTAYVSSNSRFKFLVHKDSTDDEMNQYDVAIEYMGSNIAGGVGIYFPEEKDRIVQIFDEAPMRGCQTIIAHYFLGGAHGDCTFNMAISCGPDDYFYEGAACWCQIGLEDVNDDGAKELSLIDYSFLYYTPDVKDSDHRYSLCFAESPYMTRYAMWTSRGWRFTVPGDSSKPYAKHLDETLNDESSVSNAIAASYYALMSGQGNAKAKKILEGRLPSDWISIKNKVFADIRSAVLKKDFITAVPLPPAPDQTEAIKPVR